MRESVALSKIMANNLFVIDLFYRKKKNWSPGAYSTMHMRIYKNAL